uniref:SCAN box domain-containing protein n=1 Tax=Chrysemys picta bellii TaxID=8478 RepID=A0A8C3FDC5_CHRPI
MNSGHGAALSTRGREFRETLAIWPRCFRSALYGLRPQGCAIPRREENSERLRPLGHTVLSTGEVVATLFKMAASPPRNPAGEGPGEGCGGLPVRLTKMGPEDDPEAFLVTFEWVAMATQWPLEHWATILAPYLTGPAQAKVKATILDQTGISPETYRQRLHREKYPPGARLQALAQKVHVLCWRWLEPERRISCQVAEAVVLEQFPRILPTGEKERILTGIRLTIF